MVQTVKQVVGLNSVPQPHQAEGEEEAEVRGRVLASEPTALGSGQHKSHIHMIAKPGGEADVPAVPEVLDVAGPEGVVEVVGRVDPKQVADPDGESAVAGEIEVQVKAVAVHVRHGVEEPFGGKAVDPVALDQGRQDELVQEACKDALDSPIQVNPEFGRQPAAIPVLTEPAVSVDGARRNSREKEEEGEELIGGERNDQTVSYAEDDVQATERHVRDPQEPELGSPDGQWQESSPHQGEQGQQQLPSGRASTMRCMILIQRKAWTTIHWKMPQASTT